MSTNTGSGGFSGDDGASAVGTDPDPLEELSQREGAGGETVFVPPDRTTRLKRDDGSSSAADTEVEAGTSWVDDLPEDLQEYARGKAFQDPAAVLRAQREAEANMHRLNNRLDQVEGQLQATAHPSAGTEEAPAANFWEAVGNYGIYMANAIENGEVDAQVGMTQFVSEVVKNLPAQINAAVEERLSGVMEDYVAPLSEESWARRRRDEASDVVRRFPQEYNELRPRMEELVRQRVTQDPEFVNRPDAIRDVFNQALAEKVERERRSRTAGTADGGSRSRGRPVPSPERDAAQLLADMEAVAPPDMSGGFA